MISISVFLVASYLMMAMSYTITAWLDTEQCTRYWYLLPFSFGWCILICWFYFPCEVGLKLYKKLNDTKN
jgi:hypothetical protein